MPGRLLEVRAEASARLLSHLYERCDRILVYAYGDWLTRFGGLDPLATAAGLTLQPTVADPETGYPPWRTCAMAFVERLAPQSFRPE